MTKETLLLTVADVATTPPAPPTNPFADRTLITVPEFLSQVPISRATFYKRVKAGEIQLLKIGKKSLLAASAPLDYLHRLQGEAA